MSTPTKLRLSLYAVGTVGALACAAAFAAFTSPDMLHSASKPAAETKTLAPVANKVAASVNGQAIYDSELAPALAQGVDRAIAVDRYVNKALAAELARKLYDKDAQEALRGAEREVLSQLYVAKMTEKFRAGLAESELKAFYDTNVKVEDYTGYKVRFLTTQDEKEAGEVTSAIAAGKIKDVEQRFKSVKEGGDGFVMAAELPYGLGSVVRSLKKGEYSRPVVLRNGYFILHLEDSKVNPKPDFKLVTEEIKNVIVAKKLTDELTAARSAARVELH